MTKVKSEWVYFERCVFKFPPGFQALIFETGGAIGIIINIMYLTRLYLIGSQARRLCSGLLQTLSGFKAACRRPCSVVLSFMV